MANELAKTNFSPTRQDIDEIKQEIKDFRAEVGRDVKGLRVEFGADLADMQTAALKWLVPMLLGQTAAFAAIVRFMG